MDPGFNTKGFRQYQDSLKSEKFNLLIDRVEALNTDIAADDSLGEQFGKVSLPTDNLYQIFTYVKTKENELFNKGEKPEALIDYPVHAVDYEPVDLFNWQEQAKDMISQLELTRRVSAQSETIDRYVREEKIVPDLKVPIGEKRYFNYFLPSRVSEYCKQFGWEQISAANRKTKFMEMAEKMQMSYSYKPVFIKAFLDFMDEDGKARLEDVVGGFTEFYENRKQSGLPPEQKPCIFTKCEYSNKDVENLILSMPFKRFEDMGFMHHSKNIGIVQLDRDIIKNLTDIDIKKLIDSSDKALKKYFG